MKEFNKEEYNRMCAEFLGWELKSYPTYMNTPFSGRSIWFSPTSSDGKTRTFACERGKEFFDSDWNWIMEVYNKINHKDSFITLPMNGVEDSITPFINESGKVKRALMSGEREVVAQAIWKFLNWYKENK